MVNIQERYPWMKFALALLVSFLFLGDLPVISARVTTKHEAYHANFAENSEICESSSCKKTAERMLESLNENQDPCEDFYEFACGGWIRKYSSNVTAKDNVAIVNNTLRRIVRNLLENNDILNTSTAVRKAKTFYNSCLRKKAEDKDEVIPKLLLEIIKEMGGWHILPDTIVKKQKFDLQKLMVDVNKRCFSEPILFRLLELSESTSYVLVFTEAHVNYNKTNDLINVENLTKICGMMGANVTEARTQFVKVLHLREELSNISIQSNVKKDGNLNVFLQQSQSAARFLNWSEYIDGVLSSPTVLHKESILFLVDTGYIQRLDELIAKYNKTEEGQRTLIDFMMWHVTLTYFNYLNKSYEDERHEIDIQDQCVLETTEKFRAPVGALYVKKMLTSKSKSQVKIMSRNIRRTFEKIFTKAQWMTVEIRQKLLDTIDAIRETIGFPDYISNIETLDKGFSELEVNPTRFYHNMIAYYEFIRLKYAKSISAHLKNKTSGQDSSIIKMNPAGIDAYYKPFDNEITISAGIMQLPYYDENSTMSFNYGTLGIIIGHELTHAIFFHLFSKMDKTIEAHLNKEKRCIEDQYTNYTINGLHLDGSKTVEEDIGDNNGLKASLYAYLDYSTKAKVNYTLPGMSYNHRQQFFIAFAQMWCRTEYKNDELKHTIETDQHSVNKYRVIGPLSNSEEFSKEFNCPVGSRMNPDRKCMLL